MKTAVIILVLSAACSAQIIQVDAGTSTLGQSATGATVSAFTPNSTTMFSGGVQNGHPIVGAAETFDIGNVEVTAGTQQLSQTIEGTGVYIQGIGVSAQRESQNHDDAVGVFAGTVGVGYFMPYIKTAVPQHAGGGFFVRHRWDHLKFGMIALDEGSQRTSVGSMAWKSNTLDLVGVGGLLNGSEYFSGQGQYHPLKPITFFGGHVTTFTPIYSVSDDAGASVALGHASVTAMALRSASAKTVDGESLSFGLNVGFVRNYAAVTKSGSTTMLIDSVYQQLSRHWTAQQIVTRSNGVTNIAFGGDYTSNRLSAGVDYGVGFVPLAQQAFQRTMSIHVAISIRGTQMTAQSVMTHGLRTLYQVTGERWTQGPMALGQSGGPAHHVAYGKYHVSGIVTDTTGNALEGVAVIVGKDVLYSNTTGRFDGSRKNSKAVSLHIDLEQTMTPGTWSVKDAPQTVIPVAEDSFAEVHITLVRP